MYCYWFEHIPNFFALGKKAQKCKLMVLCLVIFFSNEKMEVDLQLNKPSPGLEWHINVTEMVWTGPLSCLSLSSV